MYQRIVMIRKLVVRFRQGKIAFKELRKQLGFFSSLFLLYKMVYKFLNYKILYRSKKIYNNKLVELQLLPFIFLYADLKRSLDLNLAIETGGEILAKCGALDIALTLNKFHPDESLADYIRYLKKSKYFKQSRYHIVKEDNFEVKIKVTKCVYCELLKKHEIFELAPYLCKSDEIFFKNYHPNIKFILKSSIARGDKFCDETYQWKNNRLI